MLRRSCLPSSFWVLEDTSSYHERELHRRNSSGGAPIAVRLYRVRKHHPELVAELTYIPKSEGRERDFKGSLGIELLRRVAARRGVVVAGSRFAHGTSFLRGLRELGLDFVVALPFSAIDSSATPDGASPAKREIIARLDAAEWVVSPVTAPGSAAKYSVADLGAISLLGDKSLRCVGLSTGGIADFRRGLVVGVSSFQENEQTDKLAGLLGWSRWIRFISRRASKAESAAGMPVAVRPAGERHEAAQLVSELTARVNLKLARKQDSRAAAQKIPGLWDGSATLRGVLASGRRALNVVELFAGAGGMGLGFLMAGGLDRRYRIIFSGEIDPVFASTLALNHEFLRTKRVVEQDDVPENTPPCDLRLGPAMDRVQSAVRNAGGIDILIGGPPCQGFSNANRNSWSAKNPNNRLADTYFDYVERLRPRVFIMENVQGILWTPRHDAYGHISVAEGIASRAARAGYRLFPMLLDAAWYGVPQHRNRFFLIGIHADLGYGQEDFGARGPYPAPTHGPNGTQPYVTVREAIADLPPIENGAAADVLSYSPPRDDGCNAFLQQMRHWASGDRIHDHVTSRHAEYVIERYRRIPEGGNWSNIASMMTNYAAVERTHSNIYRRLIWDEPAITIGHYRKAMLVHPSQHRGLSLREASRLQSFPDWFRFAGSVRSFGGGLTYRQQQLGNAVCPLVTKAVAQFLFHL